MPQLTQLPEIFWSQFFWLAIVFGAILFGIGYGLLPKIQSTVDARDNRISEDLAIAQRARAAAEETEEAYRARIDESRAEALKVAQAAKQASAGEAEGRVRAADAEIGARVAAAEAEVRRARDAAISDIERIAVEAAREMVAKIADLKVSPDRAATAVKAALTNG